MKKIILVTSSFPYGNGEQFLETEVNYYKDIDISILPISMTKDCRKIPKNIEIDTFLADNFLKKSKFLYLIKSFKNNFFYKELIKEKVLNIKKLKILLSSMYLYQMYYELFDEYFSKCKNLEKVTLYTYWHNEATYALQILKEKYNYKLISRIHRGDLYKESKIYNYMPLKKQFINNIDTIYTITKSANIYLEKTYGYNRNILKVSRLGVRDNKIVTQCSSENELYIVSCSFLTQIKRVDKVIYALRELALQKEKLKIYWTHIGDGILFNKLVELAKREFNGLDVTYDFVGKYNNKEVYEYYKRNRVDVFINTSISEGVPVSIMEAMSCHIPIVAPDIGGVSDMVIDGHNGFLLSSASTISEIVKALENEEFFKEKIIRKNAYNIFLKRYNADINYKKFVKEILN